MAAAHITLPASSTQQLQQVPSINIIDDGSPDLKNDSSSSPVNRLDKENLVTSANNDEDDMYAHETSSSSNSPPTSMTKCKSLLNMKNLPKLSLTNDDVDSNQHHQMIFDDADQSKIETNGLVALGKTDASHQHHNRLSAFDSKLPYKQNFFVGSNNNLFFAQQSSYPSRRLNRKCLSRINLNLYQQQPLIMHPQSSNAKQAADSSKKMYKKSDQATKNKVKTLNHSQTSNEIESSCSLKPSKTSNLEAFNRMTKPYSSSSIMNLERLHNDAHRDASLTADNGVNVPSSTSSNQILSPNVNDFVLSSQFRKGSNLYINYSGNDALSSGYGLGYLRSSKINLYKSSTSLNALDLELLDSVSVGSFDRESIYSNYANSECELSSYCLYDPVLFVQPSSQQQLTHHTGKMTSIENKSAQESGGKLSNSMASLRINSSNSNNKTNSKVIDWLQNI